MSTAGGSLKTDHNQGHLAPRILETGKEAFTVWQVLRAGVR